MTAATRPRRRLEPDARREQILDCAVRLFGERPYPAVSTADIAAAAGVARGLLNHYFGTKRELYLEVVRRIVMLPEPDATIASTASVAERVQRSVTWFLDTVGAHGTTFVAVVGAEGVGADPEIEQILAAADDIAARAVLEMMGLGGDVTAGPRRAAIRAYGGLVKAAVREWVRDATLTREQVHALLCQVLLTIVDDVLPQLPAGAPRSPRPGRASGAG
jgi:AcrR family transcriptional regulator